MPHLNSKGQVAHGVGGKLASLDNESFGHGAVFGWLNDDTIAFANGEDQFIVSAYNIHTKEKRRLYDVGANAGYAGSDVVATFLNAPGTDNQGVHSNVGFRRPRAGLITVGLDGTIAYKPEYHSHGPVVARAKDGTEWEVTGGTADDLMLLGGRDAIWREGFAVRVSGIPQPIYDNSDGLWSPQAVFVDGKWWIAYYSGARGIVIHPFDSFDGYSVLPKGDGWFCLREVNGKAHFAISSGEGQQPGDIWHWIMDPSASRRDIRTINAVSQPKPEDPKPQEPQPEEPKKMYEPIRSQEETVRRIFDLCTPEQRLHHAFVAEAVAYDLRERKVPAYWIKNGQPFNDPGDGRVPVTTWCVNQKRGVQGDSEDVISVDHPFGAGGWAIIDILAGFDGRNGNPGRPAWIDQTQPTIDGGSIGGGRIPRNVLNIQKPEEPKPEEPKPEEPKPEEPKPPVVDASTLKKILDQQYAHNNKLAVIMKNTEDIKNHLEAIRGDLKNFTTYFKKALPDILKALGASGLGGLGGLFGGRK